MEHHEETKNLTSLMINEIENNEDFRNQFNERLEKIKNSLKSHSDDKDIVELQKKFMEGKDRSIEQTIVTSNNQNDFEEDRTANETKTLDKKKTQVNEEPKKKSQFQPQNPYLLKLDLAEHYFSEQMGKPYHNLTGTNFFPEMSGAYIKSPPQSEKKKEPSEVLMYGSAASTRRRQSPPANQFARNNNQPNYPITTTQVRYDTIFSVPNPQPNLAQIPTQILPSTAQPSPSNHTNIVQSDNISLPKYTELELKKAMSEALKHDHEIRIFTSTANHQLHLFYSSVRQYLTGLSTGLYGAKSTLLERKTTFIEKINRIGKFIFTAGVAAVPSISVIAGTTGIALPIVSILMPVMIKLASFGWDKAIGRHIEVQIEHELNSKVALFGDGYDGADMFSSTVALNAALCFQSFLKYLSDEDIYKFAEQWGKHFIESILEKEEAKTHGFFNKLSQWMHEIKNLFYHPDDLIYINQIGYTFENLCANFFSDVNICFYNPDTQSVNAYGYIYSNKYSYYFNSKDEADNYLSKTHKSSLNQLKIYESKDSNYFYTLEWAEKSSPHPLTIKELFMGIFELNDGKYRELSEQYNQLKQYISNLENKLVSQQQSKENLNVEKKAVTNTPQVSVKGNEAEFPPTFTH